MTSPEIRFKLGMMKVSILSLLDWERDECEILQLSFVGKKVGLLRKMDSTPVTTETEIELIAISSGCATRADLDKSYEEKWDRSAISSRIKYPEDKEKYALTKPEHTRLTTKGLGDEPPLPLPASERCPDWWNEEYYRTSVDSEDAVLHFYNVLWIERQGNLAYRRQLDVFRRQCGMIIARDLLKLRWLELNLRCGWSSMSFDGSNERFCDCM